MITRNVNALSRCIVLEHEELCGVVLGGAEPLRLQERV